MSTLVPSFSDLPVSAAVLLGLGALLGGLVRGFSGFGFAMVFVPLATIAIGPVAAVALIWVVDAPFAFPLAARSVRHAEWREVLPLLAAATLTLPVGVWALVWLDPLVVRWTVALLILAAACLLASGWRYAGRPGLPLSLTTGGISGFCNGLASLGGMPLAVFWLGAQRNDPAQIRHNMMTYFALSTVVSGIVLVAGGLLGRAAVALALPLLVPYAIGLLIGSGGFRVASERTFRRIAYAIIGLAAVLALPPLDIWLRG